MNQKRFFSDQGLRNASMAGVSRLAGVQAQPRPEGGKMGIERCLNPCQATLNQVASHRD
jgi:hypothetical protein